MFFCHLEGPKSTNQDQFGFEPMTTTLQDQCANPWALEPLRNMVKSACSYKDNTLDYYGMRSGQWQECPELCHAAPAAWNCSKDVPANLNEDVGQNRFSAILQATLWPNEGVHFGALSLSCSWKCRYAHRASVSTHTYTDGQFNEVKVTKMWFYLLILQWAV